MFDINEILAFGGVTSPQALAATAAEQAAGVDWTYVLRVTAEAAHLLRGRSGQAEPTVLGTVNLEAANKVLAALNGLAEEQPKALAAYRAFLASIGKGESEGARIPVGRDAYRALIKIAGYHPLKGGDIGDDMNALIQEWIQEHGMPTERADKEACTMHMVRGLQEIGYRFTPGFAIQGELAKIQGLSQVKTGCLMDELLEGNTLPDEVEVEFRRDPWEASIFHEFQSETLLTLKRASRVYKYARKTDAEDSASVDWQALFAGATNTRKGGKPQYQKGERFTGIR